MARVFISMIVFCFTVARIDAITKLKRATVDEWYSTKIEPKLFNWTALYPDQFEYRISIKDRPDLPSWLRYMYSSEHGAGFLYGTPPDRVSNREIKLDAVALDQTTFETRHIVLSLTINHGIKYQKNTVQMKIDNLDWIEMMDPGRMEDLLSIYRNILWPESKNDLHVSLMESAVEMGGRKPLKPQQREGVFVHLSSNNAFSSRLNELQEEIKPLYKLTSCTYKRTSVQTIFESAGFKLDWCAYHLSSENGEEVQKSSLEMGHGEHKHDIWESLATYEVLQRTYIDEFAFAIAIPGVIFAILVAILSIVLCLQHEKLNDSHSELYFQNIFHICEELRQKRCTDVVQVVQCSDRNNQPTTSMKSLRDLNSLVDNVSIDSNSPNNSLQRSNGIATTSTLRPRPPPYKPKSMLNNGSHI